MLYTAAPLIDAILGESYDPREASHYRPFAAYWNGWSHPHADYREARSDPGLDGRRLRARSVAVGAFAAPLLALAALAGA